MSLIQLDRLSRQTQHKSHTIARLHNQINCMKNDNQTQSQLISRIQSEKVQLRKEIQVFKRKQQESEYQRQNVENRYLLVLKKLEDQVEQGKKKFTKINNKIMPLIDYDSVRLSILNEVSQQHDLQMQKFKHTIEVQKDQIHKLKRQRALVEHKLQSLRIDHEDKVRQMNNCIKNQSSQNQLTSLSLQMSKQIEGRLKTSYQTVRKQAEYYKQKYFTSQKKYQQRVLSLERQLKSIKSNLN